MIYSESGLGGHLEKKFMKIKYYMVYIYNSIKVFKTGVCPVQVSTCRSITKRQAKKNLKRYRDVLLNRQKEA